jgi:hypothetical protein
LDDPPYEGDSLPSNITKKELDLDLDEMVKDRMEYYKMNPSKLYHTDI